MTKTDDTNVTLTLGGTPTTALLRAASLTLGWTGQLAVGRGGTGLSSISGDWLSQYALLAGRSGGQIIKGGTAAADGLTLQATSGVGVGSEIIKFLVGNAGATEAARFEHSGQLRFGSAQASVRSLWIDNALDSTAFISVGIQPTYTGGAVTQLQGLNVQPTFSPTGNVSNIYGCILIAQANPGGSSTITEHQGALFRATAQGTDGTITSQFAVSCECAYDSTLKPANSFGMVVRDVGSSGITVSSGIYITKPTGSTSNYYMAFNTGDGTALGSYAGRIPVQVAGVTQYIPYYN